MDILQDQSVDHDEHNRGYLFASLMQSDVYDAIVIRSPAHCRCWCPTMYGYSERSLEEHIELINRYKLEKAIIIAEDIGFIRKCPSLKYLRIIPADTAPDRFDYSPLYEMSEIRYLDCTTAYGGPQEPLSAKIDYSQVSGLQILNAHGKGHQNYHFVHTLEELWVSGDKSHKDLRTVSRSVNLKKLWLDQCSLKSLQGIEIFSKLQYFVIGHMRSLEDLSALPEVAGSLRALSIENCPKITDFQCLYDLVHLEHLHLHGKNELPSLDFINRMKKLQTFTFSMTVLDGNLSPCLKVPYASSFKNKKQYNLKDKDLPKQLPTKPFELL